MTMTSPLRIPDAVAASPLMRRGGFDVFEGLLDARGLALMRSEAERLRPTARVSDVAESDDEEVRGGSPARRLASAPGGSVQDAFYASSWVLGFLNDVAGVPLVPTGERGTYSYYVRPGDHLALHRDIVTCDLAVITCLRDTYGSAGGGLLCLYPARHAEPLSAIRATPDRGAVTVRLEPGQTIVMFGGIVPHRLTPVDAGQERIISILCYRVGEPHGGATSASS
jgi:hypothetical protein